MRDKIKQLIQNSRVLSQILKEKYLKVLKFFPENKLEDLLKILENEQKETERLTEELKRKKSEINKTYIEKIEGTYKKEFRESMNEEEAEEKGEAEKILKQLDE
jgi:pyruvate-formate lyase-activating enzyme